MSSHKGSSIASRYISPHWEEMVEAVHDIGNSYRRFVTGGYYNEINT